MDDPIFLGDAGDAMLLATHRGPPIDLDEDEDTAAGAALTLGTAARLFLSWE